MTISAIILPVLILLVLWQLHTIAKRCSGGLLPFLRDVKEALDE